ncbi:MAG: cupin domain-containing protein [Fusobacteria bacterium]|nr:cupin domain-containing protein [Fusobacteriota bacterium]
MTLGLKIKRIRLEKKFSLRELATMVELSASFLSQIEQEKASPSIENLKKIANALGVKVSYLIEDDESPKDHIVVRKNERRTVESVDSRTKISLLSNSDIDKNMEPIYYEIKPGGESGKNFYSHHGEEFIYVIEGELEIYIDEDKTVLKEGDSMYFKSMLKHRFKNNSNKMCKVLWVVTPPTF